MIVTLIWQRSGEKCALNKQWQESCYLSLPKKNLLTHTMAQRNQRNIPIQVQLGEPVYLLGLLSGALLESKTVTLLKSNGDNLRTLNCGSSTLSLPSISYIFQHFTPKTMCSRRKDSGKTVGCNSGEGLLMSRQENKGLHKYRRK